MQMCIRDRYKLRFYNFRLVIFLLAISVIGIVLVGSAREDLKSKQLVGVILGLIIMVILSLMDYSWISNFQWIMYGANIVLLLIVRLFGDSANGAARWIDFGFIRFQPTELSKIIIILFFARFFICLLYTSKYRKQYRERLKNRLHHSSWNSLRRNCLRQNPETGLT